MSEARLNFADHPDSTFSCNAVFIGGVNSRSRAHQVCSILEEYVRSIREAVPEPLIVLHEAEASLPELETQAFMRFRDENGAIRFHLRYLPTRSGFVQGSPAHEACMRAHGELERVCAAVSDALMTRAYEKPVVISREKINTLNGNV